MKYLLTITCLFIVIITKAQNAEETWEGLLPAGNGSNLHIAFNIKSVTGKYITTFDVVEQKAFGVPCNQTTLNGDSIHINIAAIGAAYAGKIKGNTISGTYVQGMAKLPVTLTRQIRPQTPQQPYAYASQDVEYDNADKSVHFGATLTKPKGAGRFPAVVIISGSGAQDRDGTLFGHKLYAVLADYLTKQGIAVLRVDDRGVGKTSKGADAASVTSASFAYDVEAGLNYLKSRSDVNVKHLGLIGHSEGGIIAPMVAARRKDVSFIVLWGAPAVGGAVINVEQNGDQVTQALHLDKNADDEAAVDAFKQLHEQELQLFSTAANIEDFNIKAMEVFNKWKGKQTPQTITRLMVTNNSVVGQTVTGIYDGIYKSPWFKFFVTYKPETDLSKVTCPVLAVNGAKDTQVNAKANLNLITEILTKSGNKTFKTLELPGLNHLLQTAQTGKLEEYSMIEETMSPMAMKTIADWIKMQVK